MPGSGSQPDISEGEIYVVQEFQHSCGMYELYLTSVLPLKKVKQILPNLREELTEWCSLNESLPGRFKNQHWACLEN